MAKADGTLLSYLYKSRQFFAWLSNLQIKIILPIQDKIIAAYLVDIKSHCNSDSTFISTAASLKWLHSLVNSKPNPVDAPIVQQIINSGKKTLHKPPVQKLPLSLHHVKSIIDKFGSPSNSLLELRTACYISLKYALMFRHDEMAQLKANHLTLLPDDKGLSIFIPRSKTDVFREGSTAYISNSFNKYSPVSLLQRYISGCDITIGQDSFIFTPLSYFSSTKSYKPILHKSLSYTRCREIFLDALKQIGIEEPKAFGLHSLRSGGATHLANKGVSEELIMQHGRWKTTNAKNRYVQRELGQRLAVSTTIFSD